MNKTMTLAEVVSQVNPLLQRVISGKDYDAVVSELKNMGFVPVSTNSVEDATSAIERYNQVHTEGCVLIALQDTRKFAQQIKDASHFEYVCNVNEIPGEQFFIWYENADDYSKVKEKASPTLY